MPEKRKTTTAPRRRRRTAPAKAAPRRRRTLRASGKAAQKAALFNILKGVAGGALSGQLIGIFEKVGIDAKYTAYFPLIAAYLTETKLKQPALAAGMAGAAADRLLADLGLMDSGSMPSEMKVKSAVPGQKMLPPARDMSLQDYGYSMLNDSVYSSDYANQFSL